MGSLKGTHLGIMSKRFVTVVIVETPFLPVPKKIEKTRKERKRKKWRWINSCRRPTGHANRETKSWGPNRGIWRSYQMSNRVLINPNTHRREFKIISDHLEPTVNIPENASLESCRRHPDDNSEHNQAKILTKVNYNKFALSGNQWISCSLVRIMNR